MVIIVITENHRCNMDKNKLAATQDPSDDEIRNVIRRFYDIINKTFASLKFGDYSTFLNWGYVSDESLQYSKVELPKYYLNKNSTRLILELIGDCDITNCEVLDVSCGRGGGIQTMDKFFKVKKLSGIDLNSRAILFCKKHFNSDHIRWFTGNAERLPFKGCSFDIVSNVESSGNYLNIYDFYIEVCRVLRMNGYFLYTDLFKRELIDEYLKFLRQIGFVIEIDRDISNNVLLSRDEESEKQLRALHMTNDKKTNVFSKEEQEVLEFFLAPRGSRIYKFIKQGYFTYRLYRLKKVHDYSRSSTKSIRKYMNKISKSKETFIELVGNPIIGKLNP